MTEFERGMILSSMSDDSVARTLGRSVAWVKRVRDAAKVTAAPAAPTLQDRVGRPLSAAEPPQRRATPKARPVPARPAVVKPKPVAAPVAKPVPRPAPPPRVSARVVRWAKWFLAAGWTPRETAWLFDVNGQDLVAAVRTAR